ncbi:RIP metalloprotease RseP [Stakelama sp. CBK3Z-3]|uniref:Zinc metalloprotease n=1 Tax=Stakelama flava TaxID=2860338 RepID=A0ABS6XL14_9SPHN|nr:RIP metalloprotease RseP [Stakelama flava]MBW4330897.1 RIP metalloprotease RseP [Stakelama flava]
MTESPGILMTLVAFALVLGPLVFLHELGHYVAGRAFGVKADAFSIGFGREIAGFTDRRGTRWKFGWLPLGGYVRFSGDMNPAGQPDAEWLAMPADERARTFQSKPVWQRAIIVAAGPVTNFLIAIVIFAGLATLYGVNKTPSVVGVVAPQSPAAEAGLRPGDRITAMGGRPMTTFTDLAEYTTLRPGETVSLWVQRGGGDLKRKVTLSTLVERDRFGNEYRRGQLGIGPGTPVYKRVNIVQAPVEGVRMVGSTLRSMIDGLGQIITGRRPVDELGGPIRIAGLAGQQLAMGPVELVFFIALISINLGFINLLPVPMLDGGHLFFYAVEAVRRRPVGPQVMEWAFRGGLAVLLALFVFVTFNDLGAFGLWHGIAGLIG